ncbi:hypothetical protein H4R26_005824 [Coemansia thaxteri]|uniref:Uncharacterized protein n=1 Tax=Coemansia thaxteri TaxID=2663907 RepID=A0A9W8EGS0_9FUNG|nr:hypothetical protein H4R26_005824 [Coemansia thaxteri]
MQAAVPGRMLGALCLAIVLQLFCAVSVANTQIAAVAPIQIDIAINTPDFLIQIPFSVSSGPNTVSGFIKIYYRATRTVKYITDDVGQLYLAKVSTTTFLFMFQFQSSSFLPGSSRAQYAQDVLYLDRVSAEIVSVQTSQRPTIGAA